MGQQPKNTGICFSPLLLQGTLMRFRWVVKNSPVPTACARGPPRVPPPPPAHTCARLSAQAFQLVLPPECRRQLAHPRVAVSLVEHIVGVRQRGG